MYFGEEFGKGKIFLKREKKKRGESKYICITNCLYFFFLKIYCLIAFMNLS